MHIYFNCEDRKKSATYVRALETCEVFRDRRIGADGVQAAFIVAAMACGYPYEVLPKDESLLERMVAAAAEEAVLAALP
jgi:cobalamin synthase